LANRLSELSKNVIVLHGGMTAGQARSAANSLKETSPDEERVIVASGCYLGEGFDDARLDTPFHNDADLLAWNTRPIRR